MAVSMRDLDVAFQGAGQKSGLEIWRIENFRPVPIPKASYGKFFMGDAYVILKTTALKSGALRHDIHYWLGKDTSQDEASTAAIKTVELDASLGGRAVQYREVQGHESEKFLSYFKPCIIPQEGGAASGFKLTEVNKREEESRLYICRGKHTVHVKEVPFARSSLTHDDIFILDTKSKIFQFNGSNSSIQERAKALEVVQYLKDTYHDGKCDIATVEDGKMMADAETGEFWGFFGGFAPLPKKTFSEDDSTNDDLPVKLLCIEKGKRVQVDADSLTKELLATTNCYVLDCGVEVFVWMGRSTTLEERKTACVAADELLFSGPTRKNAIIIRVIEGYETVAFRSKFSVWPQLDDVTAPEDGKFKIAALLKLQGVNVKGLEKAAHLREEPQPYIDCTGSLQVWRVNGQEKSLIPSQDQSKFYSGDCYIFQYNYHGEDKEEVLVGTWFGKKSIEQERSAALSMAANMVESLKFQSVQARVYEGKEPIQFFAIFQSFVVFKGGVSSGFKKHIAENGIDDETYSQDGTALFRIEGSGPDNMQSIQVDLAASSLNSSYCYILHSGNTVFTWSGNLTSSEDQELVERQLDIIKPNLQSKPQKEGYESDQFWNLLKGKSDYGSKRIKKDAESELHLLSCTFTREGDLKVTEIFNFTQDDLMTEDIFILDCKSIIFVWVGQEVNPKNRTQALSIGEKFLEKDFLMEKLSRETPIFIITEENEPSFFTRFFTWDSAKSSMHGNSFQRKLAMVKNGVAATLDKPKRRVPLSYGGRSAAPTDKPPQRSRSVSFSPERVRVRGRSPAFNALAAAFENPNRNLSTPPPVAKKLYPKSFTPDSVSIAPPKSSAIAALTSSFEKTKENPTPRQPKVNSPANNPQPATVVKENNTPTSTKTESPTTKEDVKDGEAEEDKGLTIFPYERLTVDSTDPAPDIDVTKRETYLSSVDFKEKFAMKKDAFFKLPKWKQNKLKVALKLF